MSDFEPGSVVVGYLDAGQWSACFGMSYRDMLLYDACTNRRIVRQGGRELRHITGAAGIASGRNAVARDFLKETNGEWLFFIDTDMGFGQDTVNALVESADPEERPVVGGLAFQLRRKKGKHDFYAERYSISPTLFEWVEIEKEKGFRPMSAYREFVQEQGDPLVMVAGTGAACLLIHRTALEAVRDKHGPHWFQPITHPSAEADGGPRDFSEDLSFCIRLAGVDIPVYVNTAVKTTHEKGGLFLDEPLFIKQEREKEQKRAQASE